MNHHTSSICFSQFVQIPLFGSTWVEREKDRPSGLPFFRLDIHREEDSTDVGMVYTDPVPVQGLTLNAGRWLVIVDRPRIGEQDSRKAPLAWAQTAWLALAAPLIALVGLSACLIGGLFQHIIAKPLGWAETP